MSKNHIANIVLSFMFFVNVKQIFFSLILNYYSIDDIGIFNDALTENDVNSIMKNGLERAALTVEPSEKLAVTWGNIKEF